MVMKINICGGLSLKSPLRAVGSSLKVIADGQCAAWNAFGYGYVGALSVLKFVTLTSVSKGSLFNSASAISAGASAGLKRLFPISHNREYHCRFGR